MRAWIALALLAAAAVAGDEDRRARLRSGEWEASNRALDELVGESAEVAVPLLTEALSLDEAFLRRRAAQTLGVFGKDAAPAVPALIQALYDEDRLVAIQAASALDEIGAQEAVPYLIDVGRWFQITPPGGRMRLEWSSPLEAWIGKRQVQDPRVLDRLRDGLAQKDPALRAWCVEGIGNAGPHARTEIALLRAALEDESFEVRGRAARALGRLQATDEETIAALSRAWAKPETFVRRNVAVALGELGEPAFPAIGAALDGKELRLRRWAAHGLSACRVPPVPLVASLCSALDTEDRTLRLFAIRALGVAGGAAAPALPRLLLLLSKDEEEFVTAVLGTLGRMGPAAAPATPSILPYVDGPFRTAAIQALGGIGAAEALPTLVTALEAGSFDAADALARMGDAGHTALIAATRHEKVGVRQVAVNALFQHQVQTPDAVAALRRIRDGDPDPHLRNLATAAVARAPTRDDEGLEEILVGARQLKPRMDASPVVALLLLKAKPETLVALLSDANAGVRRSAALACAKDGSPQAKAGIVRLLDDPEVRDEVVPLVVAFGDPGTVDPLLRVLAARKRGREVLAEQIASFGEAAVPALTEALGNSDVRVAAAEVLGQIGPKAASAAPQLALLLADPDRNVAGSAVRALALVGSVPHVRLALLSKDRSLVGAAVRAVAKAPPTFRRDLLASAKEDPALRRMLADAFGQARDVEMLVALARDPDALVRASAVRGLGECEDAAAFPALRDALRDADADVRATAAKGLAGKKEALEPLMRALDDESAAVRSAAATSLGSLGGAAAPAAKKLVERLADGDAWIGRVLKRIGPPAVPFLLDLPPNQRKTLEEILRGIGAHAAPPLIALLEAPEAETRRKAAWGLGLLGRDAAAAVPALVKALGDDGRFVATQAAWALGEIGPGAKDAIPELEKLLKNPARRSAAADALKKIRG